jgi:Tryptophan-rich Synechocystis species C-terminal domain
MSDPQSLIMTPGVEFSADSYIYQPLPSDAIIDPHSAAWVGDLLQANAAVAPTVSIEQYTNPIFIVGANQPTVQILAANSYAPLSAQLSAVPLPSDFKPDSGSDHEAIIFQPSTGKYWEVWVAALTGATTTDSAGNVVPQWEASWGGYISNLATNSGSFSGGFGTAASGLPLLAGLMTIAEQQAGVINHSIHFSIPQALAKVFVGAAMRTDGTSTNPNAIPEGATFRLPASLDLDSMVMDPYTRMIAEAVQKYGMVVSDTNGSGVGFTAQNPDGLYATDPYYGPNGILHTASSDPNNPTNWGAAGVLLASFPWSDLEAVETNSSGLALQAPSAVVAGTASRAVQGGAAVPLLSGPPVIIDSATTLSSATIKIANAGGSAITGDELFINGQQGGTVDGGLVAVSWNDSTKVLTLTGNASIVTYQTLLSEVAYKDAGTDSSTGSHPQHTVTWTVNDGAANISTTSQIAIERAPVATVANVVLNADFTTLAASSLFTASDPDGDRITEYGLMATGNGHFVLNGLVQANNQEIDVTAAQISQLTYQSAWGTNSLQVRVDDGTLWSAWQSFTVTAPPATVIESSGSTSLVEIGNNYYLESIGSGTGLELKYGGAPVTVGEFGSIAPIGAVQAAGGYDIAWKIPGMNQFTFWATNSNGNYVSNIAGLVSGTSFAVESLETTFGQDLNGDGTIGPTKTVIRTDGPTSLAQVANEYFLYGAGGTSGPSLKYAGAAVTVGEFNVALIGAIKTATGYDIAWQVPGSNEFSFWATDNNGNYLSTIASHVSGTNFAAESLETTFGQDLNGDGTIGPTKTVIQTDGSTSLAQVANEYFLYGASGTSGPSLKYAGAAVTVGEFSVAPIGAIKTATGYDIALKVSGTNELSFWATDNNGNYLSTIASHVSGTSFAAESLETTFGQDLNGDGTIGPTKTVIQTDGPTSLTQVANEYFLYGAGGTSGPSLKDVGAPVTVGEFANIAPIGAIKTATGYDIAWQVPGSNEFSFWATDSNGNYLSNITGRVSGTSFAAESLETTFHQDLNGDGVIGVAVAANATLELNGIRSDNVTFDSSTGTLKLDSPSTFKGQIAGFTGDGTLSGSDHVDLLNMRFSSSIQTGSSYDPSTGALTVSNGATVDVLHFIGSYSQDNFEFASDAHGGTIVYDPPTTSQLIPADSTDDAKIHITGNSTINGTGAPMESQVIVDSGATLTLGHATAAGGTITNNGTIKVTDNSTVNIAAGAGQDNFVFAPNFGQATISHFTPGTDSLLIDHAIFSSLDALFAAMHNSHGNAVITDAAHDTITVENVTTAQLLAHHGDFHLV